jgi:hypothetical protein
VSHLHPRNLTLTGNTISDNCYLPVENITTACGIYLAGRSGKRDADAVRAQNTFSGNEINVCTDRIKFSRSQFACPSSGL